MTKVCACCKQEKAITAFHKVKSRPDGCHPYCKACRKKHDGERYKRDGEKIRARNKKWQEETPHCKRAYWLKQYGISPEEWGKMFEFQGGRCAICGIHQSELSRALAVDHDHVTGKVRGLLCLRCNVGMGHFGDDEDLIKLVLQYLQSCKS